MPVTFTGIEYVDGTDSLKLTFRLKHELFIRDYQQTIFDDLDLEVLRRFRPFPADMANNYLNARIAIYANKTLVIGKLRKIEENNEDIKFDMLYRLDKRLKSLTVRNTALIGYYGDAENLTIFKFKNLESEAKLTRKNSEKTFFLK